MEESNLVNLCKGPICSQKMKSTASDTNWSQTVEERIERRRNMKHKKEESSVKYMHANRFNPHSYLA